MDWRPSTGSSGSPGHNGKLLTYGAGYLGLQFAMAPDAGDQDHRDDAGDRQFVVPGLGAWQVAQAVGAAGVDRRMVTLDRSHPLVADILELLGDKRARRAMDHLPLSETDRLGAGKQAHWFQSWLTANGPDDPYWGPEREHRGRVGEITAPVLLFGGWQDFLLPGKLADYAALRAAGRNPYLTLGPWLHVDTEVMTEGLREALVWFSAHVNRRSRLQN